MARSHVLVPSTGTIKLATSQYTDGANVKDDEVNVLGEQFLASFHIATLFNAVVSTATANSHLLQIMAGSTNRVRIRCIHMYQTVAATAAVLMDTRLYRLTTAGTGGTAIGVASLDPADGAAGATAMTLPTVKGTEGTGIMVAAPYMMQTIAASAQLKQPILIWEFDRPRSKPLIIAAGTTNGIAIKNPTAVAGGNVTIGVWGDETPY